jgi:hypothetical protein
MSNIHSVGFKACIQSGFTNSARFTNSDVNAILFCGAVGSSSGLVCQGTEATSFQRKS